jgi:hypothetical protein
MPSATPIAVRCEPAGDTEGRSVLTWNLQPADGNPGALGTLRTGRGAAVTAEERIGNARRDRALLKASDSDRDRVLDILKTAFVQGRLTEEELDLRVGQTLGSRTWGDLTAVTADIPAWPLPQPVHTPARTSSSPPMHAVIKAVACAIIALAAITILGLPGIWTMPPPAPSATAQACQIFYGWQNHATGNVSMLNVAAETASNGSDPLLATDLATLQRAWYRQEIGGHPQSIAAQQAQRSQLNTDISQVGQDCQVDGY